MLSPEVPNNDRGIFIDPICSFGPQKCSIRMSMYIYTPLVHLYKGPHWGVGIRSRLIFGQSGTSNGARSPPPGGGMGGGVSYNDFLPS